jgi:hypothetical protein
MDQIQFEIIIIMVVLTAVTFIITSLTMSVDKNPLNVHTFYMQA